MGDAMSLARMDATEQAELVRRGEVSPRELVDAAIERLERIDPQIHAVVHPAIEAARERADSPLLSKGPFRGVPFLMKDIGGDEAGRPYHAGMEFLKRADHRASVDSHFTEKLAAGGLISLGRTTTSELAVLPTVETRATGVTRNPWNLAHRSGGSSGGSAAAVAAGIVPMAHGSDGGGSIRIPASHCGLVGLKPTRGRSSFGPGKGERWSGLSCEFAVTRSVRDAAQLLDIVSGSMPGDPYAAAPPALPFAVQAREEPARLRVGLMRTAPRNIETERECTLAVEHAARLLEGLGHDVSSAHPEPLEESDLVSHYVKIVSSNVACALDSYSAKLGKPIGCEDVEPLTWALAERGRSLSAPEFLATLEYMHGFGRRLAAWWDEGFDLLLTPTTAQLAPPLGRIVSTEEEPLGAYLLSAPYGVFTLPFNLSGQPGLSVPLHVSESGLPMGVQIVARAGNDGLLLSVAAQLEAADPWRDRIPPIFG